METDDIDIAEAKLDFALARDDGLGRLVSRVFAFEVSGLDDIVGMLGASVAGEEV